jgi:hypothetical protein
MAGTPGVDLVSADGLGVGIGRGVLSTVGDDLLER